RSRRTDRRPHGTCDRLIHAIGLNLAHDTPLSAASFLIALRHLGPRSGWSWPAEPAARVDRAGLVLGLWPAFRPPRPRARWLAAVPADALRPHATDLVPSRRSAAPGPLHPPQGARRALSWPGSPAAGSTPQRRRRLGRREGR